MLLASALPGIDTKPIEEETVHKTLGSGFLAINIDTIINLLIVSVIFLIGAWVLHRQLRRDRPSRFQVIVEMIIDFLNGLIRDTLGTKPINIAPLAISLFTFLLLSNWFGLIPFLFFKSPYFFKSPTNDVNVAFALAIMSIVLLHIYSIRFRTPKGYVKHYFSVVTPRWLGPWGWTRVVFAFLELIQEISRPITLSFRLYFNIFVGELMLVLIIVLLSYASVIAGPVWVGFSIFVGAVQAFIFTMLTIAYIAMGTETAHSDDEHAERGTAAAH
jgi:F-type H+-transporting ATPase subunit a